MKTDKLVNLREKEMNEDVVERKPAKNGEVCNDYIFRNLTCSLFHESDDDLPDILDEGIPVFVGDSD